MRLGRRRKACSIFAKILRCTFYYGAFFGVICFRLKKGRTDERLVAQSCCWYKWCCVLIRIVISFFYIKNYDFSGFEWNLSQVEILICMRVLGCLTIAVVTVVLQLLYERNVVRLINSFLRIYRRVNALSAGRDMVFGGTRQLTLLLFKMVSLLAELYIICKTVFENWSTLYTNISTLIVNNLCFLGYLTLGALYDAINCFVRSKLRQQLRDLQQYGGDQPCHRRLKAAEQRLDECLEIYDKIRRLTMSFHKLFEPVLGFILIFGFLNLALASYLILFNITFTTNFWVIGGKMFLDLMLLIMTIHGARSSFQVVRRLSLENYYVSDRNDWHMKFEMFLNRLHYYELKVRPLGLFEVSNGLILVFLSGMVTYLTFVLQYSMQHKM